LSVGNGGEKKDCRKARPREAGGKEKWEKRLSRHHKKNSGREIRGAGKM